MTKKLTIRSASPDDAGEIAAMTGALLDEITQAMGARVFDFNLDESVARLKDFLDREIYFVFLALDGDGEAAGFVALYESHALYAGGAFGTIAEFYVRPPFRSLGMGRGLLERAKACGRARGWTRLEVTTPPLPQFEPALAFYEREGFSVTGGRKMKAAL
ncbi:GNAT family N-acetyltransferase [Methylococcus sp. EFPC2]|uniref:GNAT family N-acetyltransferase n=1 Tax=Methylococcus sp. EFPC2 TaxID=2812648 RepID=UPI0019682FA4|nr:GNAT family N-acetyltransferase [Methylococcus sp. EFPC2]QSA98752.1 GNAT family N-acetyltransferase [Methylococcus sp. EFPC2]